MTTKKRDLLVQKICNFLFERVASTEYQALLYSTVRLGTYVIEQGMHGAVITEDGRRGKEMFRENVTHNL